MPIKRTIIIPAILTLSTVGSILAGTVATLAATAPTAVVATSSSAHPDFVYQG